MMSEDVNRLMATVSRAAGRELDPDVWEDRQIMNHGTGVISSYYDDGTLKSEIPYRRGRMHGKARYFTPDGRLFREEQYISGEKQP